MWPPPRITDPSPVQKKITPDMTTTALVPVKTPLRQTAEKALTLSGGLGTIAALGYCCPNPSFAQMTTTFALAGLVGGSSRGEHCNLKVRLSHGLGSQASLTFTSNVRHQCDFWNHSRWSSLYHGRYGLSLYFLSALGGLTPATTPQALALGAAFISSINIGGGFLVTKRMLDMFKRKGLT